MAAGGVYRIDSYEFPAPVTSWNAQIIGPKLNGLPALNTYYIHNWQFPGGGLDSCDMENLLDAFYVQDASGQLSFLETDEYNADASLETYGTVQYQDFIIQSVFPIRRGLPHYENVSVTFEVYIG
jgi:hypothetical protein